MRIAYKIGSDNEYGTTKLFLDAFKKQATDLGFSFIEDIKQADGLFIFTPVHWFGTPHKLKCFIDNELHDLEGQNFECEEKLFGAFAYAPEGGAELVLAQLALMATQMGFTIPPYSLIYYRGTEKDKWAKDFSYTLSMWAKLLQAPHE